jgi:hypothetical protein
MGSENSEQSATAGEGFQFFSWLMKVKISEKKEEEHAGFHIIGVRAPLNDGWPWISRRISNKA